jgi:hypothetical protein
MHRVVLSAECLARLAGGLDVLLLRDRVDVGRPDLDCRAAVDAHLRTLHLGVMDDRRIGVTVGSADQVVRVIAFGIVTTLRTDGTTASRRFATPVAVTAGVELAASVAPATTQISRHRDSDDQPDPALHRRLQAWGLFDVAVPGGVTMMASFC